MVVDPQTERFRHAVERLDQFETMHPVHKWRYRGVHIWPIIKYVLVKQLIVSMNRGFAPSDHFKTYPRFAKKMRSAPRVMELLGGIWQHEKCEERLPVKELRAHQFWFFGSGSGFLRVSKSSVSQHHHALRTALMEDGSSSVGMYSGFNAQEHAAFAGYGPSISFDPHIKMIARMARVPDVTGPLWRKNCHMLSDILSMTGHAEDAFFAFVDILIGRLHFTISCFKPLMRNARPSAVISSNYASFYGWALAYLCRDVGIPFVDVQHGIEGRFSGAYHFTVTPKRDWSILPTAHLCWSTTDAQAFVSKHASRRAAVIRPTWEQMVQFLPDVGTEDEAVLARMRGQGGPLILFAAQQADDILVARTAMQRGANILFRGHPTKQGQSERLVDGEVLDSLGCEIGGRLPLPQLLDRVDGVVTGYSAAILEACLKGLPCLATGSFASLLEEDYSSIVSGLLSVRPSDDLEEKVATILDWSRGLEKVKPDRKADVASVRAALRQVEVLR